MLPDAIGELTAFLYGPEKGADVASALRGLLDAFPGGGRPREPLSEKDAVLIAYPDQFTGRDMPPLRYMRDFADRFLGDAVSAIHLLPFSPYTSDDGFSVSDYRAVEPGHGGWEDILRLAQDRRLMYDFVCNHVSASHEWFRRALAGEAEYAGYFIEADPEDPRLALVIRPRPLPLLSRYDTANGPKWFWTTFSRDQIDLNYSTPAVLLAIAETLLFLVSRGAGMIRLDAVGFLWKRPGTSCMHLPETHAVVKLFRLLVDRAAPGTVLVTETNVPHRDNLSYLGDGTDEAGMVYQFPLPPLVLHSFIRGDASHLSRWAEGIEPPGRSATFFNFLASHDGIGLTPVKGILPESEVARMLEAVAARGGRVSVRTDPGGGTSPYEMNISFLSALSPEGEPPEVGARKLAAAHAIAMAMPGVPGIYAHSLVGSRNWNEGVEKLGHNRAINREKLDFAALAGELDTPGHPRRLAYEGILRLLEARRRERCFHPAARFRVLDAGARVFAALREDEGEAVICFVNVSGEAVSATVAAGALGDAGGGALRGLLGGECFRREGGGLVVELPAHGIAWLKRSVQ